MSKIKEIIETFFHGNYSPNVVNNVHARIADGADLDEKDEAMRGVWNNVSAEMTDEEIRCSYTEVATRLGFIDSTKISFLTRYRNWIKYAAFWFIPIVSILFSLYMFNQAQEMKSLAYIKYYVPYGKRQMIELPDKTNVWLNGGSLLIYPNQFVDNKREVYLSGEGYFDVIRDEKAEFTVQTTGLRVRVLGTKFNISAYPDESYVETTLNSGKIRVLMDNGKEYDLEPDQQLRYDLISGNVKLQNVQAAHYSSWINGGLRFMGEPFEEIIRKIEKRYDVKVTILNSERIDNSLTITFNENESLATVMMLIKTIIPEMDYKIEGKDIYIK